MGQHYVPQNYLKGFSDPERPAMIWISDKSEPAHRPKRLPIKAVAQRPDFYTAEAEQWLNKFVEIPAQEQLRQLAAGEHIEGVDRLIVAIYIQVMALRVPFARNVLGNMVRDGVADFVAELKSDPNEVPEGMSEESFHQLLDSWQQGIHENGPSLEPMRKPWIQRELVDRIYSMTWRVVGASAPNAFLTGDNPVSFTYETGLLHPEGELTFPISSQAALHASWVPGPTETIFVAGTDFVAQEINRRTAHAAERFLFAANENVQADELANQPPPRLCPFPW